MSKLIPLLGAVVVMGKIPTQMATRVVPNMMMKPELSEVLAMVSALT